MGYYPVKGAETIDYLCGLFQTGFLFHIIHKDPLQID